MWAPTIMHQHYIMCHVLNLPNPLSHTLHGSLILTIQLWVQIPGMARIQCPTIFMNWHLPSFHTRLLKNFANEVITEHDTTLQVGQSIMQLVQCFHLLLDSKNNPKINKDERGRQRQRKRKRNWDGKKKGKRKESQKNKKIGDISTPVFPISGAMSATSSIYLPIYLTKGISLD